MTESKHKRYLITTVSYFIGNVFTKLISFILLPLYTKRIDPELFGIYGVNLTIIQLCMPVAFLVVWDGVFRFALDTDSKEEKYRIISNGLPVMWVSSLVCAGIILLVNVFWDLHNPFLVCMYAIASGFQYFYGYVARSMKDNKIFIISGCTNSAICLLMNWIGIAYLHHGIEVLYYSYILGTAVQVLIIELKFGVLKHYSSKYVERSRVVELLKFSGPLALNSATQWLLTGLAQFMIAYKLGTYYNGQFSVAAKFATVIALIVSIFQFAWYELAYEMARDDNHAEYYSRTINILFKILALVSAILILVIKFLYPYYVGEAYWESRQLIPYIVVYSFLIAYAGFVATIFMSYKDVNIVLYSSLAAGGLNFALILILIPACGFIGVPIALVCASFVMLFIRSFLLANRYAIRLHFSSLLNALPLLGSCAIFFLTDSLLVSSLTVLLCMALLVYHVRSIFGPYLAKAIRRLRSHSPNGGS